MILKTITKNVIDLSDDVNDIFLYLKNQETDNNDNFNLEFSKIKYEHVDNFLCCSLCVHPSDSYKTIGEYNTLISYLKENFLKTCVFLFDDISFEEENGRGKIFFKNNNYFKSINFASCQCEDNRAYDI